MKVAKGHLSIREFKKILHNTFIYESILIKMYMNSKIKNTQIFYLIKYDLNGHWRSQKVTFMFILILTYVLMDNLLSLFYFKDICISLVSGKCEAWMYERLLDLSLNLAFSKENILFVTLIQYLKWLWQTLQSFSSLTYLALLRPFDLITGNQTNSPKFAPERISSTCFWPSQSFYFLMKGKDTF